MKMPNATLLLRFTPSSAEEDRRQKSLLLSHGEVIKDIPASAISLNLGSNGLGKKTGDELALAFAAIPLTVTSLDLSLNQLNNISVESINTLSNALLNKQTIFKSAY